MLPSSDFINKMDINAKALSILVLLLALKYFTSVSEPFDWSIRITL